MASVFLIAAGGKPECKLPKSVEISVNPVTKKIAYDYSRTMADLQSTQTDTINPYGMSGVSITQGFMEGAIEVKPEVKLNYYEFPKYGAACVYYDKITINISIDPQITIAKEVYKDRCMQKAVLNHEMKHIMRDREIVNKYGRKMGNELRDELTKRGFITANPIRREDAQHVATNMQNAVFNILEREYKNMELKRAQVQQAVDSKQEYDRVAAECPNFKTPRSARDAAR